jgi:molybdate/tungstate transport system substrate-binding protein
LVLIVAAGLILSGCSDIEPSFSDPYSGELIILHAGSLTIPVQELTAAFQKIHPEVQFLTEAAGSRTTARKVSELGHEADLVMSADYQVIDILLIPDHASWNLRFASNAMVVVYTDQAVYADQIDSDNWYEILTRDGVEVGRSNPQADPNGYRTLMVWQLAEQYYQRPGLSEKLGEHSPQENIRPKETDLIPLLQTGDLDYAFNYRSVAVQHGLRYVDLPDEIDLSSPEQSDFYQTALVELDGSEPGEIILRRGEPIIYGVTIPLSAPNPDLAALFLEFLFSPAGTEILAEQGQLPLEPSLSSAEELPDMLQSLVNQGD